MTSSLRVFLSLVALLGCMNIQAQVVKIYENGVLTKTYRNTPSNTVKVVVEDKDMDANILNGQFSVSADKKVKFTKGNLQATYSASTQSYTWGIAAHQWDYVGKAAGNTSITSDGKNTDGAVVDLFGWSTSTTNYGISTSQSIEPYSGDFKDWGGVFPDNNYSTLSSDEWVYLLNTDNATSGARTQTNRFAKALLNGVQGLLIFPDGYNGTTAVSGDGIAAVNSTAVDFPTKSIPSDSWTTMQSAGVVFLPVAGLRYGSDVFEWDSVCYYWSSTAGGSDRAFRMNGSNGVVRYSGLSVRLVSVVSE